MNFIIVEIVKGNIIVLLSYLVSFFIEKMTKIPILCWNLRQVKNDLLATVASYFAAIYYFVINLIILFNDLRKYPKDPEGYSFLLWLVLILICAEIFRRVHYRLTPIDPTRDHIDFDYLD